MITFDVRYDEATALWQYKPSDNQNWSTPAKFMKMNAAMAREIQLESLERATAEDKRWNKPIDHATRSKRPEREKLMDLYEIRGGKVVKIGYTHKDRVANEAMDLLAALGGIEGIEA
jgi:hypothetical protein